MFPSALVALPLVALLALSNAAPTPTSPFHVHHFHSGQKLVAAFTPTNESAQLGFSFCLDMEGTRCTVLNIVGHAGDSVSSYLFRIGELPAEGEGMAHHGHHDHDHAHHGHSEHDHAHHDHSGHDHSHHDHAAHAHSHAAAAPAATPAEAATAELAKAAQSVADLAESMSAFANDTVMGVGALAYVWLPLGGTTPGNITPVSFEFTDDSLGKWIPLNAEHKFTILKDNGKLILRVGEEATNKFSWPMNDAYMHVTAAVRYNGGTLAVTDTSLSPAEPAGEGEGAAAALRERPPTPLLPPGRWSISTWGSCSNPCGRGEEAREVTCVLEDASGTLIVVTESFCGLPRPSRTRECHRYQAECINVWEVGYWGQCSARCGGGQRSRRVECRGSSRVNQNVTLAGGGGGAAGADTGTGIGVKGGESEGDGAGPAVIATLPSDQCVESLRPAQRRECNVHPCPDGRRAWLRTADGQVARRIKLHSKFSLRCPFAVYWTSAEDPSKPRRKYAWYKDGVRLPLHEDKYIQADNRGELRVKGAGLGDSGEYSCASLTDNPKGKSHNFTVTIEQIPGESPQTPGPGAGRAAGVAPPSHRRPLPLDERDLDEDADEEQEDFDVEVAPEGNDVDVDAGWGATAGEDTTTATQGVASGSGSNDVLPANASAPDSGPAAPAAPAAPALTGGDPTGSDEQRAAPAAAPAAAETVLLPAVERDQEPSAASRAAPASAAAGMWTGPNERTKRHIVLPAEASPEVSNSDPASGATFSGANVETDVKAASLATPSQSVETAVGAPPPAPTGQTGPTQDGAGAEADTSNNAVPPEVPTAIEISGSVESAGVPTPSTAESDAVPPTTAESDAVPPTTAESGVATLATAESGAATLSTAESSAATPSTAENDAATSPAAESSAVAPTAAARTSTAENTLAGDAQVDGSSAPNPDSSVNAATVSAADSTSTDSLTADASVNTADAGVTDTQEQDTASVGTAAAVDADGSDAAPPTPAPPTTATPRPVRYAATPFSNCSASCGPSGLRQREVRCAHAVSGATLPLHACERQRRPELGPPPTPQEPCNRVDCAARWVWPSWTSVPCPRKCGVGYKLRRAHCSQTLANGTELSVPSSECSSRAARRGRERFRERTGTDTKKCAQVPCLVRVREGDELLLPCPEDVLDHGPSAPAPARTRWNVTWTRREPLASDGIKYLVDGDTLTLTVYGSTPADSGGYRCDIQRQGEPIVESHLYRVVVLPSLKQQKGVSDDLFVRVCGTSTKPGRGQAQAVTTPAAAAPATGDKTPMDNEVVPIEENRHSTLETPPSNVNEVIGIDDYHDTPEQTPNEVLNVDDVNNVTTEPTSTTPVLPPNLKEGSSPHNKTIAEIFLMPFLVPPKGRILGVFT